MNPVPEPIMEPLNQGPEERDAPASANHSARGRNILWILLSVLIAFLVGFGWQYIRATAVQNRLAETEQELLVERLRVGLAQAAIDAQTGEFESARSQMSQLFNRIQSMRDELPDGVRRVADDMLAARDNIITGLSRGSAETAGTLFGFLDRLNLAAEGTPPAPEPDDSV